MDEWKQVARSYFVVVDSEPFASFIFIEARLEVALRGDILVVKVDRLSPGLIH